MILLTHLLNEEINRESAALNFLSTIIKNSPYANKIFLAGGAVRDSLMGKPVKDIDIVITEPDGGIKFSEWITRKIGAYKQDANPLIFPRFGTAKFNLRGITVDGIDLSGVDIEAVMTRGEKYTPGSRKPEVVYSDLKTDAERRDLTINALYKDLTTGEILDPTGKGIDDIKNGVIRTPLDPDITFDDDPLRMLRVIRFAVRYNWKIPKNTIYYFVNYATKRVLKVWPVYQDYDTFEFELSEIIGWLGRDFINGCHLSHVNKKFWEKIENYFKNAIDNA